MRELNDQKEFQRDLLEVFPDFDFRTPASARNHYGTAIEKVVCLALGLDPITISGRYSVNFDARKGQRFYEIKSVRLSGGKSPIYEWRRSKEARYHDRLSYVFGGHKVKGASTNLELWEQLEQGVTLISASAKDVHRIVSLEPLQKIRTSGTCGYDRPGYVDGYRNLPIKALLARAVPRKALTIKCFGRFSVPVEVLEIPLAVCNFCRRQGEAVQGRGFEQRCMRCSRPTKLYLDL